MRGRRLAFDYGDVRIGVAVSDPDSILCTPLPHLLSKNPALLKEIRSLMLEYEPVEIFIGLPMHLSGVEGESVEKVRHFALLLEEFSLPIIFVDERLSTVTANSRLRDAGYSARNSRGLIDSASAVAILEQGINLGNA